MASWSPGRPPNALDVERTANGRMTFLGFIVSTGAAVDNSSTVNAFATTPQGPASTSSPNSPLNLTGTLAGRFLLVQATAAGSIMASQVPLTAGPSPTVAGIATAPPAFNTIPGPKLQAEERVPFIMGALDGWLQFIPTSGSAQLAVWELT